MSPMSCYPCNMEDLSQQYDLCKASSLPFDCLLNYENQGVAQQTLQRCISNQSYHSCPPALNLVTLKEHMCGTLSLTTTHRIFIFCDNPFFPFGICIVGLFLNMQTNQDWRGLIMHTMIQKLLAKISNRLSCTNMPWIISLLQIGFIQGQFILENALVAWLMQGLNLRHLT